MTQKSLVDAGIYLTAMDLGNLPQTSPLLLLPVVMARKSSLTSVNHYTMRLVRYTVSSQLESLESLQLTVGQSILLSSQTDQSRYVRLFFQQGIARISGSFGDHFPDITLAFCGDSESSWLRLPDCSNFLLEALTNSSIGLHYADNCPKDQDLLWDWLFDFHLVRHPVGAEARLVALLKLLIGRFGIRRSEGYELPFPLGHARMAELIGATRSTVTRQITLFRNKNDLQIIEPGGTFLLSARLIESTPAMDIRF
ncbi:helix-turn-helix domain-containing protein [Prochlorococcus marinus]|uniref:helix-turn-helix domain-containing protein n=1 Tax=Prochlorococcus TaxID=1218 RepID=UPI001F1AF7DE|nr:helix-turn-helix domain-containing protein [Prochlorococcus marinus]